MTTSDDLWIVVEALCTLKTVGVQRSGMAVPACLQRDNQTGKYCDAETCPVLKAAGRLYDKLPEYFGLPK